MNQEQVTTENTEEKAAEVTTQSETTQRPEEAIRPRGKWFGRGIYGSKDVPIRILDGLIGVLIVVIVGMIIFFAVRGGFNIVYDTGGGSEVAARKVRYGEFLTEPETPYKPGYTFDGWYTEKEGETVLWYFQSEKVTGDMTLTAHWVPAQFTVKFDYDGAFSLMTLLSPIIHSLFSPTKLKSCGNAPITLHWCILFPLPIRLPFSMLTNGNTIQLSPITTSSSM